MVPTSLHRYTRPIPTTTRRSSPQVSSRRRTSGARLAWEHRADAASKKMACADNADHRLRALFVIHGRDVAQRDLDHDATSKTVKKNCHSDDGNDRGHTLHVRENFGSRRRHSHESMMSTRVHVAGPRRPGVPAMMVTAGMPSVTEPSSR